MTSPSSTKMRWPADLIVKDLDPAELAKSTEPPVPKTALDIARESCEKIGAAKPGLFSTLPDDLPWTD